MALGLAGALALAGGAAVVLGGDDPTAPAGQAVGTQERTQRVLLLSVPGPDGTSPVTALLAHDPSDDTGALVLLPGRVLAAVPGVGTVPLGDATALPDRDAARTAVSDLLGVTVDGSWKLDENRLAALVDAVGGVEVEVDEPVLEPLEDGSARVLLPAGVQQVSGDQAVRWLQQDDVSVLGLLPRLQQVLGGVLEGLPSESADAAGLLVPLLDGGSLAGLTADETVGLLTGAAEDARAERLSADGLPVLPVETGGEEPTWRLDRTAAQQLVDRTLGASVPEGQRAGGNRVLVLNGVGTPGLGDAARDELVGSRFVFAGSRNAERGDGSFGYATSQVLIRDDSPESRATGYAVAGALRLPGSSVKVATRPQTVADVIVVLGADYVPQGAAGATP